jgi:hypothetical protein
MVHQVDMALNSVTDVLTVPFTVVKKGVVEPLLDVNVKVFVVISLILLYVTYTLLLWERSPASCLEKEGVCSQIFLGNDLYDNNSAPPYNGVVKLLELGIFTFVFLTLMKLVAVGVSKHGIKPNAFIGFATAVGIFEALHIIFVDLFQVGSYAELSAANSRTGMSFKEVTQAFIYQVLQLLRLMIYVDGAYTFIFLTLAVATGVVGGLVARV